ncbi:MAG: OmpA family protein [Cytophagales bacterium]
MKSLKIYIFSFVFSILVTFSQNKFREESYTTKKKKAIVLYQQADNEFVQRRFLEASILYQQAIKKDEKFAEPYFKLGLLYKFQYEYDKAKEYFEKGIQLQAENPKFCGNYFSVAEIYLREGNYDKAESYSKKYLSFSKEVNLPYANACHKILIDCNFAREQIKKPLNFTPKALPANVNNNILQYFPSVTADGKTLVYTSSNSFSLTGNEDLMVTKLENEKWTNPTSISSKINSSRENEGTASISGDGKTLVFTGCGRRDSKGNCDLYISYKIGDEWTSPTNMGNINSNEWDSQPSLSADGRTLYFVSMRRGSMGEQDIYVTYKKESNEWSTPKNLGTKINTIENESSPFIHPNGTTLYFASNGRPCMGGLDMFVTEIQENGEWNEPVNLGYPLNTSKDDMGLVINTDFSKGYYNSDVIIDGKQHTHLFEFEVPTELKSKTHSNLATGTVSDALTKKKIGSKIDVIDLATSKLVTSVYSDEKNGSYTLVLNEGKEYALYCTQKGYLFKSLSFNYTNKTTFDNLTLNIELDPIKKGASITLNNLFFESGKYDLHEKSITELNKLVDFMFANPTIKVEISGHTDDVGQVDANLKLSTQRAKSVFDYLIKNGIQTESIICKGYGSSKPVVPNTNDENRQQNRRIEFTIIN